MKADWKPTEKEKAAAEEIIHTNADNWPEDAWHELSPSTELYLYTNHGVKRAKLFPVKKSDIRRFVGYQLSVEDNQI